MAPAQNKPACPWKATPLAQSIPSSQSTETQQTADPAIFTQFLAETAPEPKPLPSCSVGFFLST